MAKKTPRKPRRGWSLRLSLFGILCLGLIMGIWIYFRYKNQPVPPMPAASDPLSGFKVMDLPRSDVPIGAVWTQGIGPVGVAPKNASETARSLDSSQIESSKGFKASVVLSLFRKLGWDSSGDLQQRRDLRLEHLSVTGIKQASSLPFVAGNTYLWEAIRVDSFSVKAATSEQESVRAEIQKATAADNVSENVSGTDTMRVTATGTKLFVAYRVVGLGLSSPQAIASSDLKEPTSSFALGQEYRVSFENLHPGDTLFSKRCTLVVSITSFRQLKPDGSPLSSVYHVSCGKHPQLTYSLGAVGGSLLMTTDSLEVSDFQGWPGEGRTANGVGRFAIERRTLNLEPVEHPNAPGW